MHDFTNGKIPSEFLK